MPSSIFKAEDFENRQELENYIRAKVGSDANANRVAGHQIIGKKQELEKLNLDDQNSVFGVAVLITDYPFSLKKEKK